MPILYRNYQPSDAASIENLVHGLYYEDGGSPLPKDHLPSTIQWFELHPEQGAIMVADYEGQAIGYSMITTFWSNEYGGLVVLLDELYIQSDFRGQGIGKTLIEKITNQQHYKAILLEVSPANLHAMELYKRLGFVFSKRQFMVLEKK